MQTGWRAFALTIFDFAKFSFASLSSMAKIVEPNQEFGVISLYPPNKKAGPKYLGRLFYLADREGFEPSIEFYPYTRFPSVRLQPLGHPSFYFFKQFVALFPNQFF